MEQTPHVDWMQVKETVRMINLAVAQIEVSMNEGDDSVDALTKAFTEMAAKVQIIEQATNQNKDDDAGSILQQCEAISAEMQHAIIAFQFYDKLTQRLSHVSESLESLAGLVGDEQRLNQPKEWTLLQEQIKSKYTMPAEHHMFEMVMQDMSIKNILKQALQTDPPANDVELF